MKEGMPSATAVAAATSRHKPQGGNRGGGGSRSKREGVGSSGGMRGSVYIEAEDEKVFNSQFKVQPRHSCNKKRA